MNQMGEYFTGVAGDPSGIGGLGVTVTSIGADAVATQTSNPVVSAVKAIYPVASLAGLAACTYHGYKRNQSWGWALGWGLLGSAFPFIGVPVALAQGFGKRK
jgi:hypothetical protein